MHRFSSLSEQTRWSTARPISDPRIVTQVGSHKDNYAGGLWDHIITSELESTNFGLVCLTPDNLESRWIHFEAAQ